MAESPVQVHWVVYLVPPVSWEAVPIARNPKVLLVLAFALGLTGAPWPGPASAQGEAMLVRVDTVRRVPLSQTVPVIGRLVAQQVPPPSRLRLVSRVCGYRVYLALRISPQDQEGFSSSQYVLVTMLLLSPRRNVSPYRPAVLSLGPAEK